MSSINSLFVLSIVGSLLAFSFVLLSNALKVNVRANLFLGAFLLLWPIFWLEEVGELMGLGIIDLGKWMPPLKALPFLMPPLFYFSVLYYSNPFYKLRYADARHLAPFVFVLTLSLFLGPRLNIGSIQIAFLAFQFGVTLFYLMWAYALISKHEKQIDFFNSERESVDLHWVKQIISALLIICIVMIFYNALTNRGNLNLIGNVMIFTTIYYVGYQAIGQKEIYVLSNEQMEGVLRVGIEESQELPRQNRLMSDMELHHFVKILSTKMKEDKLYLREELSLASLAECIGVSPHQLSYIINKGFHQNFFQFVNRYRVEEAKRLLISEKHQHLSIIGIGYEAGFNSKTAFNTVFKRESGMTPSAYRKEGSNL